MCGMRKDFVIDMKQSVNPKLRINKTIVRL